MGKNSKWRRRQRMGQVAGAPQGAQPGAKPKEIPVNPQTLSMRQLYRHRYRERPANQFAQVDKDLQETMTDGHGVVSSCVDVHSKKLMPYLEFNDSPGMPGLQLVLRNPKDEVGPDDEKQKDRIKTTLTKGSQETKRAFDGQLGHYKGDGITPTLPLQIAGIALLHDWLAHGEMYVQIEPGINPVEYPIGAWDVLPARRMYLADPQFYENQYRTDAKYVEFVLLDENGKPELEMSGSECKYIARNPILRGTGSGYGRSPVAECAHYILTASLTWSWNSEQFTDRKKPHGAMQIPEVSDQVLDEFLAALESNMGGAGGGWHSFPVIRADGDKPAIQWIPLGEVPTEMQFQNLFMLSVGGICGKLGVTPEQIGFSQFSAKQNVLQDADPQSRIQEANLNGFVSIATRVIAFLDEHLVKPFFGGRWKLVAKQLTESTDERKNKLRQERLSMGFSSVDEERVASDLAVQQIPLDFPLWWEIESDLLTEHPELVVDGAKKFCQHLLMYARKGGTFSITTQVPLTPAAAASLLAAELAQKQQLWQQQQQEAQGPPQQQGAGFPFGAQDGQDGQPGQGQGADEGDEWEPDGGDDDEQQPSPEAQVPPPSDALSASSEPQIRKSFMRRAVEWPARVWRVVVHAEGAHAR